MEKTMEFILNNKKVRYDGDPSRRLLDVLRDDFDMTEQKEGCREGECGACAVLLNKKSINSCITAIGSLEGQEVMTLEGYRETKQYKVLEEAFAKAGAVQCGFCIPGMIMAAESLLSENPNPSEADIREGIAGNLCRCTGYNMIIEGIQMAAKEGKGLW